MSSAAPLFPRVHTLVICDEIEETTEEGIYNLLGVRSVLRVPTVPFTVAQLCVFFQATARSGPATCHVAVTPASEDEPGIATPPQDIEFEGPLTVVPGWFYLWNCTFEQEGLHYVQLMINNRMVNERMLQIISEGFTNGQATG